MATCGTVRLTPGPQGPAGANGTDGTDGVNAYTSLNGNNPDFAMPAELGNGTATVLDSTWMAPGQIVYLQGAGHLQVIATPTSTTVTLKNLEDTPNGTYADNVAVGTPIADGSKLSPAGKQGPAGDDGSSGAPDDATYLTRQAEGGLSAEFNLGSLTTGMLKHTVAAGVSTPATASDGTDFLSPTTGLAKSGNLAGLADAAISRTNLGVAIGTNVQAYDALLAAIAALVTAADQTIYSTGVDTVAMTSLTAFGRSLIDDATAAAARTTLGVLPGYGILSSITGWNLNSATTDTAMTMLSARYIIDKVTVDNASTNLTTATGGLFTAAGGGGTTIAADQALSALTASTKFDDLSLQAIAGTDVFTAGTLYARCGTAQGGAATANLRIWGWKLD